MRSISLDRSSGVLSMLLLLLLLLLEGFIGEENDGEVSIDSRPFDDDGGTSSTVWIMDGDGDDLANPLPDCFSA